MIFDIAEIRSQRVTSAKRHFSGWVFETAHRKINYILSQQNIPRGNYFSQRKSAKIGLSGASGAASSHGAALLSWGKP